MSEYNLRLMKHSVGPWHGGMPTPERYHNPQTYIRTWWIYDPTALKIISLQEKCLQVTMNAGTFVGCNCGLLWIDELPLMKKLQTSQIQLQNLQELLFVSDNRFSSGHCLNSEKSISHITVLQMSFFFLFTCFSVYTTHIFGQTLFLTHWLWQSNSTLLISDNPCYLW